MLLPVWLALLVLPLAKTDASYDERDFVCEPGDTRIPTTLVCDGVLDCTSDGDDAAGDVSLSDESEKMCVPAPYLTRDVSLDASEVTNTSIVLSWSKATTKIANHSLELAGYFVTGRSEPHSFQNTVSRRLGMYHVQWLKPWTQYTLIMRPFYTETGKPQSSHKIGRAASVVVTTLPSAPEVPGPVSVLSAQQRSVVLNIVGPSSWNSVSVGFHVRWEPTRPGRGPRGDLDVSLDADWSPEENSLNVTLPLEGGWDYRVYVSAVGAGSSGAALKGPELEVDVSVPLDSYEISVYSVQSTSAVLSWRSSQPADLFMVTVAKVSPEGSTLNSHSYTFDGTQEISARHTIAVTDLQPWSYYVAILEGCSADDCSESVNTTFVTPPSGTPRLDITRVESTSPSSFEVAWIFPQSDSRLYEGFRVQFCTGGHDSSTCFVSQTKEEEFAAQGLQPKTTYYIGVSPQYRTLHGSLWLGPPARTQIETWGYVPDLTVSHHGNIDDGFSTSLFAWRCANSKVSYFQYRLDGDGDWFTCKASADCDVTVEQLSWAVPSRGYLRLTHHRKNQNLNVGIRGCNRHGCGPEKSLHISTHIPASLGAPVVAVTWKEDGAHIESDEPFFNDNRGLEILWKCGTGPDMHRKQTMKLYRTFIFGSPERLSPQIYGLPEEAQDCDLSAAKYEQSGENTYYGPHVQVPLS